ncbi:MAG: glutamate dehydrogenase (NADP+) [Glaciecola sp.]|jgi:glutamate dehydrogenase (NADP+)
MNANPKLELETFLNGMIRRNPGETEFHQAVEEVATSIIPYIQTKPIYQDKQILERMTEPDRIIIFRVCWEDDEGNIRVNRGYRVQCNNAIGPYKGGMRFHPSVNLSILKFLAFEQTFKNSLTGLPMGGGKGGSDFNPKGKSELEVMRFCQSFMTELSRHVGPNTDVPAGDIGVGAREGGFLFGQYKRLMNRFEGVMTGKALEFGGSRLRSEATGYGVVYMMKHMLENRNDSPEGKTCVISGSGNVATYCAEKLIELGAKVVTLSDSSGFIFDPAGITKERLAWVMELKNVRRGRISEYAQEFGVEFHEGNPWKVGCDLAFPCATQNELDVDDAQALVENGCWAVAEGANMPTTPEATEVFRAAKTLHAPAKASNAGGVAVSGLEMSQNSVRASWTREKVDRLLQEIMKSIHDQCVEFGGDGEYIDYMKGANIAGFRKVAHAMLAYGVM